MPTKLGDEISEQLNNLFISENSNDCLKAAEAIGNQLKESGVNLAFGELLDQFVSACHDKKSGMKRESGLLGIAGIAKTVKLPALPYLLLLLPNILDLESDKGVPVREAANLAVERIIELVDRDSVSELLPHLLSGTKGKWQTKEATLLFLEQLAQKYSTEVGELLPEIIPAVTNCMHDTKPLVSSLAKKTMIKLCNIVGNPDIEPHTELLIDCMEHPDHVAQAVTKISSTTFVTEVTGPALALMVPLLVRALNDRSASIVRPTAIICDNLFKLVREPRTAGQFMPQLLPGLDRIIETAAFPEIRAFAEIARTTLVESAGGEEGSKILFDVKPADVLQKIQEFFQKESIFIASFYDPTFKFAASWIANSLKREIFQQEHWKTAVQFFKGAITEEEGNRLISNMLEFYHEQYRATQSFGDIDEDGEGELLCDIEFSLAYGAMMLLNNTRLKFRRGQRYGLCGPNGAGKSTLMRAIAEGRVDGFPSADELKCVFVEHNLQGNDAELSVRNLLLNDPEFKDIKRSEIEKALFAVGFNDDRQNQPVGALSGGWKMKLELARAMLMKADILLLDEPTNHLDVENVKWLENYLTSNPNITSVIVSHDSGFLDNVCTYITHYERRKLVYYKGNLSKFVERRPEAKSYYTLAATRVKFSFPPPSVLLGVRSDTKAILKMNNCTFTYPNAPKPSMLDVSVQLSLSSRVGVVGANGAGKSTMIKLLTGEVIPQTGTVWKHPNIRIGYVAQHAFHHLEQHLEKTPNEYIQWRYRGGQDREVLEKATRKFTAEDEEQMAKEIQFENIRGRIEMLLGRQKLKKSYQYEVKWVGMRHKNNKWIGREFLLENGFQKLVQAFDDQEASREGQGYRELVPSVIREHIEQLGLPGEITDHHAISGLSGGQKVKVVLAAAMWNNPHMLVLDEPTNYLDRESLGGLAVAIREWGGAVIMISHNEEFVRALCPEIWHIEAGKLTRKGKFQVSDENFEESAAKIEKTVSRSKGKKKKLSRNELKAREQRRRERHLRWIEAGGALGHVEKEPDTESD